MLDKFSDGSRRALTHAKEAARRRDADKIALSHILLGLSASESEASTRLRQAGATQQRIEDYLPAEVLNPRLAAEDPIPFSDAAKSALLETVRLATTTDGLDAIRTEHLLRAVIDSGAAEVSEIVRDLGLAAT